MPPGAILAPVCDTWLLGSLERHTATKPLFVTTSMFSTSAKETAELLSKRMVLIDVVNSQL